MEQVYFFSTYHFGQRYLLPLWKRTCFFGANFKVIIYNQQGNLASELTIGNYVDPNYNVIWNASSFSDGVYFYEVHTNGLEIGKGTIIKNVNSGK